VSQLQKILVFLLLSPYQVHRFRFHLFPVFRLLGVIRLLQKSPIHDLLLHSFYHLYQFLDIRVVTLTRLRSRSFLIAFELLDVPILVQRHDVFGNAFFLLKVERDFVHFHEVVGERGFRDEAVLDEQRPRFRVLAVTGVGLPRVEDLAVGVVFEEVDVRYDVEHRAFEHPFRESHHRRGAVHVRGFLALLGVEMHNAEG